MYWRCRLRLIWLQRLRNLGTSVMFLVMVRTPQVLYVLRPHVARAPPVPGSLAVFVKINSSWASAALMASLNLMLPFKYQALISALHFVVYERFGLRHHVHALGGRRALQAPPCAWLGLACTIHHERLLGPLAQAQHLQC
jgi:hypothetical protein